MLDPEPSHIDLPQLLERFPADAALIERLLARDDTFLSLCEDYCLAATTLARLVDSEQSGTRAEIAEYRSLVTDLEREIRATLDNGR